MLVNYSLIFVSLLLFAGLAVDAGLLERSYIQMQGSAQAAASASSIALQRGGSAATITSAGQTVAGFNGYTNGVSGVAVTIQNPPTSGTYSGNSLAVLATVTKAVPTTFLSLLGLGKVNMKATALQLAPTQMSLSSAYNVIAIYTDGTSIPNNGGFDTDGYAFSANALGQVRASNNLGALQAWRGNIFTFGAPNTNNGVSNTTINLTHGSYSQMLLLASTAFGPITSAAFVVKYTDSSTATTTFNMSDWCIPQFYAGETIVSQEAYRDAEPWGSSTPTQDYSHNSYVYGYSINLDSSKTLSSLKLPAVRNVVVLALDLKQ
jgi:hypothetical protein